MQKYIIYVLINVSLQEVFFGITTALEQILTDVPPEMAHWDLNDHHISNPVIIEEELLFPEAVSTLRTLQENALENPQGKTILLNGIVNNQR